MELDLYELLWDVKTDVCCFLYREFKVFSSDVEAQQYGRRCQTELNEGMSIEERAHQDGYYFSLYSAYKIRQIDGFAINMAPLATVEDMKSRNNEEAQCNSSGL